MMRHRTRMGFCVLLAVLGTCAEPVPELKFVILDVLPHDSIASTQGLVYFDGSLFESVGGYGTSALRITDPDTGQVLAEQALGRDQYGEGLAMVDGRLLQLTWKNGEALTFDVHRLTQGPTFDYEGEGWGICFDGAHLWMSNGSDTLYVRDPGTFEVVEQRAVTSGGRPVGALNELECVGPFVFANVFLEDIIVRIDKADGRVTALIDGAELTRLAGAESSRNRVLNGIAYRPDRGSFYLTGKRWPVLFEVALESLNIP
jgi:glutaminyl-peptide cyclotransferase